jgi:phage shock protein PspC (stress-responsive transcriptional regulator)
MSEKKLLRPTEDRWIGGVCSGVARYFEIDATLVRVAWILFLCLGGSGLLAYLICWLVIPSE